MGFGFFDNFRLWEESGFTLLPYDPMPDIRPREHPELKVFGEKFRLMYGLIEWGFLLVAKTLARSSVPQMPLHWRKLMLFIMHSRADVAALKKERDRAQREADAHSKGYILGPD